MIDRGLWALTGACIAITLWFSFVASVPGADVFTFADKVGHGIAYFATTLSFLFAAVWRPGRGWGRFTSLNRWFPVAAIVGGVIIEILQEAVFVRSAELYDVVAEVIGTSAAVVVHELIRRRMRSSITDASSRA